MVFGAPLTDLEPRDLERPGLVFQIGVAPNRIDVLTAIDGVTFDDAWSDRQETRDSDAAHARGIHQANWA